MSKRIMNHYIIIVECLMAGYIQALIAALSPAEDNVEETLSTCQFAARAKYSDAAHTHATQARSHAHGSHVCK